MNKIIIAFSVIFFIIACSRSAAQNIETLVPVNERVATFSIIPYGTSIQAARNIFAENKLIIKSDTGTLYDNSVHNAIILNGYFYDEECEIYFNFIDGVFTSGMYIYSNVSRLLGDVIEGRADRIKNKLLYEFTEKYGEYTTLSDIDTFYNYIWELNDGIIVTLSGFEYSSFVYIRFDGTEYLKSITR